MIPEMKRLITLLSMAHADARELGFNQMADQLCEQIAAIRAQYDPNYKPLAVHEAMAQAAKVLGQRSIDRAH